MKTIYLSLVASTMVLGGSVVLAQQAGQSVMLQYGTVEGVNSDQNDLIVGDCVVVEQGQYTNVRRVSSINCYQDQKPAHHVEAANNCQLAKDELNSAKTDEEIESAVIKVRTLCED